MYFWLQLTLLPWPAQPGIHAGETRKSQIYRHWNSNLRSTHVLAASINCPSFNLLKLKKGEKRLPKMMKFGVIYRHKASWKHGCWPADISTVASGLKVCVIPSWSHDMSLHTYLYNVHTSMSRAQQRPLLAFITSNSPPAAFDHLDTSWTAISSRQNDSL